jgi:hypothetical protein
MEIERLTHNEHIIAVATLDDGATTPVIWRHTRLGQPSSESWELVLSSALHMFTRVREMDGAANTPYVRVIVADKTVLVQRERGTSYAVVIETGHAVAKSLHRTIKRCAKPLK